MLGNKVILVVDDEALIALDLELAVVSCGGRVAGPCHNLSDAIDLARHAKLDAAILDVDLGAELVFDAADVLAERGIPFVFHTGGGELRALDAYPNVAVCRKPCPGEIVVDALLQAMSASRAATVNHGIACRPAPPD